MGVSLEARSLNIAVIGLGKLGLPLAALLASCGNEVKGFDVLESVRNSVKTRTLESNEPGLSELLDAAMSTLEIVDEISVAVQNAEIVFLIVPTPSLPSGHFSNQFLLDAIDAIGRFLNLNQRVVVNVVSTVMHGACEGPIKERLETVTGTKIGSQLGLCYNPEFIALGSVLQDMQYPDMHLVGQSSNWAGEVVEKALKTIIKRDVPTKRMNLKEAELVKIAVNNYVTMKISYANMLMQTSILLSGIDIDIVTSAIGLDSRIGAKYLKAAAPYGGPCFPRDTRALGALYKDLGLDDSLSVASEKINNFHAQFIAGKVAESLASGEKIGIAGLSYKTGTSVIDDSPGLSIAKELNKKGFKLQAWDDEGVILNRDFSAYFDAIVESASELVASSDFLLITRPLKDPNNFTNLLREAKKPFLDLWRNISY
jgi:UDPglucose 6-dehydrogenase